MAEYMVKMVTGVSAFIVQFYDEVNKKRGKQWEISRVVSFVNVGDKAYSVMKVGSLPVDLKARILGATGGGVYGRAYRISASDVTLGTPDKWQNFNSAILTQPETEIYPGSEVTFNTPVEELAVEANWLHAPINAITNIQNQAKGYPARAFGGNHILNPVDYVLFEIESYDSTQDASATLEMYEGGLDFYPD
jgi:hypothetical protein